MADTGRRKPVQHAHSSNQISLGHSGTATYHDETQSWSFLRRPQADDEEALGADLNISPFNLVKQPTPVLRPSPRSDIRNESKRHFSTGHFLKFLPEVSSVAVHRDGLKWPDAESSDGTDTQVSLLEFGSALVLGSDDIQSGSQTAPLAAYVLPGQLNKLTLTLLDSETVPVDEGVACSVQVPCITNGHSAQWISSSGIIKQIVFSPASLSQNSGWLAVRQTGATSIFQPLLHRAVTTSVNDTSLDHNLVTEIPKTRTGLLPHADIQFHPHDPSRIAIIDVGGNWSIWKISGIRSRSAHILYRSRLVTQGSLVAQPEQDSQFDGWHKMIWLSDIHQSTSCLLIANRLSVALFDEKGSLLTARDVRVGQKDEGPVLDVLQLRDSASILVLTAVHLYLIDTNAASKGNRRARDSDRISTQIFWNHARDSNDSSLKLFALAFSDVTWLLLTSFATGAGTLYQLHQHSDDADAHHSVSDPVWFDIASKDNSNLTVLNVQFVAAEAIRPISSGNTIFFKVFTQDQEGSICEALYHTRNARAQPNQVKQILNLPKKHHFYHTSAYRIGTDNTEDDWDDFIVADGNEDDLIPQRFEDTAPFVCEMLDSDERIIRACDLHATYEFLVDQMLSSRSGKETQIDSILDLLANAVRVSSRQTLSQFMTEISEAKLYTVELESDSHRLERWEQETRRPESFDESEDSGQHMSCSRIWTSRSLLEIYEDLVGPWLSSLSDAVPDRLRVQRERLLRQVALDLFFSSTVIGPPRTRPPVDTLDVPWNFGHSSLSEILPADSLDNNEAESSAPERGGRTSKTEKPMMLLSSYTTFRSAETINDKTSAVADSILAHLPTSTDADPDNYSFDDAELNVALARNELANQEMDPKAKRKSEKLARARKKQMEKQAQMKKVAFENTTALPSIMSSQLPIRAVQSSQAGPPSSSQPSGSNLPLLSMTQPERGAYGKRDVKKTNAKGKAIRQKGF